MSKKQMNARNAKIKKLYSTGKYSQRKLAAKVGMSKSRIGEIVLG